MVNTTIHKGKGLISFTRVIETPFKAKITTYGNTLCEAKKVMSNLLKETN